MIILDTNVISEPLKAQFDPAVQRWLDQQYAETLFVTTVSLAELMVGVEIMPDGKRKQGLAGALPELLAELFGPRILSFDQRAAMAYAPLIARARKRGQVIGVADGQIAAIAAAHGFVVATRDSAPFIAAGIEVINPWALSVSS